MKESKISLLLLVSLSLLLLAFVVLFIWGFTYYQQSINPANSTSIVIKDSSAIAGNIRDSLQKMYTATINKLNTELDSTRVNVDAFQLNMDTKLAEFNMLKNEIAGILQKNPSSSSDLSMARQKIQELQKRLDDWRSKYAGVAEENKRLSRLLQQLSDNVNRTQQSSSKIVANNKEAEEKINAAASFVVTGIQLKAIMQLDNSEQETYQALQTDGFRASIDLKNNTATIRGTEMYVIILQPDGKVLKQSAWETGMFETPDGRKIYSYKMRFDYTRGEIKHLDFSLAAEQFQKGNYVLQLYHNGKMIAKTTKSLS